MARVIIDTEHPAYKARRESFVKGRYNGAFYYSKELRRFVVPKIRTDRNWILVNTYGKGAVNHSIVFIHNNLHPENYAWLKKFDDMILVCGIKGTMNKVRHLGRTIYLPLSVDVKEVLRYSSEKTKECAYAGRRSKVKRKDLPQNCDFLCDIPRTIMLKQMAKYRKVYAVGRCAIEARILGCEIGVCDERFPDPSIWKIMDSSEAVKILQTKLDRIDGKNDGIK